MSRPLAVLTVVALFQAGAGPGPAAAGLGLVRSEAHLRAQVEEPVFAWVFTLAEADSLGAWTAADLAAFAAGWEAPSAFPLDRLVALRREALPDSLRVARDGLVCDRVVIIELDSLRLDMPMPYSILGYHPGTLSFGSPVTAREWRVGDRTVSVRGGERTRRETVHGLVVWEIVGGWAVLDVDGWLDSLLGPKLDDAATMGFAAARGGGRILGVGNSAGRDGRFIFGELDFREGVVMPHGRPLARALAGLVRRWSDPEPALRERMWRRYADGRP